ncbi:hypothetical protein BGZ76_010928 [Entomortierella beljakovae]|nr:hypothetical protein BGZ76_010928 [Entomortierella beljakovae]
MESTIRIPELIDQISVYLSKRHLLACIQVCQIWNYAFTPQLYRVCSIYSNRKAPPFDSIKKYARYTRQLHCDDSINLDIFRIKEFRLSAIKTTFSDNYSDLLSDFIRINSDTLADISLNGDPTYPSNSFWNAILECPRIHSISLSFFNVLPDDLTLFWKACSNVESFKFFYTKFPYDRQGLSHSDIPVIFPRLLKCEIIQPYDLPIESQVSIISSSPNLRILRWEPTHSTDFPIDALRQIMKQRVCPKLHTLLGITFPMSDEDIALSLDAMHEVRGLGLKWGYFMENSYRSLMMNHAATLRQFISRRPYAPTSDMILGIMENCPSLEVLRVYAITGKDLVRIEHSERADIESGENTPAENTTAENITMRKDWVCQKLKVLSVQFNMTSIAPAAVNCGQETLDKINQQHQLEQEYVFRQLGRLTMLKSLDIRSGWRFVQFTQSIDMRLRIHGGKLDELGSLKNLEVLRIDNSQQSLQLEELKWMLEHWPNLNILSGHLNPDRDIKIELRSFLEPRLEARKNEVEE